MINILHYFVYSSKHQLKIKVGDEEWGRVREEERWTGSGRRSRGDAEPQWDEWGIPVKGKRGKFNVPLQWVTRGCNCRSGRNGESIAPRGVVRWLHHVDTDILATSFLHPALFGHRVSRALSARLTAYNHRDADDDDDDDVVAATATKSRRHRLGSFLYLLFLRVTLNGFYWSCSFLHSLIEFFQNSKATLHYIMAIIKITIIKILEFVFKTTQYITTISLFTYTFKSVNYGKKYGIIKTPNIRVQSTIIFLNKRSYYKFA